MGDLSKIAVLLSQQKEKLRELEEVTDAMAGASADEITAAMEKREEIFKPLIEINEELNSAGGSVADRYQKSVQLGLNRQIKPDKNDLV